MNECFSCFRSSWIKGQPLSGLLLAIHQLLSSQLVSGVQSFSGVAVH